MRESIPRQVDKESSVSEDKRGVWCSQGGRKDKHFIFSSTFLSLSHIKCFVFSLSLELLLLLLLLSHFSHVQLCVTP